jgi:hypothetical protein
LEEVGGWPEDYERAVDLVLSIRVQLAGVPLAFLHGPWLRIAFRTSILGLFRQTRAWGFHQARAHREFGSRVLKRRADLTALKEWPMAVGKLITARTKADLAQCALRFGFCIGRLQGSLRYRTLYL